METAEVALCRELSEEIPGLRIGELKPWKTFQGVTPHSQKPVEVQTFFADVDGSIDPGAEVSATEWVRDSSTLSLTATSQQIWDTLVQEDYLQSPDG